MCLSKFLMVAALGFYTTVSIAQPATGTDALTLEEYTKILAAKMKQPDKVDAPAQGASASVAAIKPRNAPAADPFLGWIYNGVTVERSTQTPLFGEILINGRSRIVYPGDMVLAGWRVSMLTERAIELKNEQCAVPTRAHKRMVGNRNGSAEMFCQYRLLRKV